MRAAYYGFLAMPLLGLTICGLCWAGRAFGWDGSFARIATWLPLLVSAVYLAEGLALALDWRGASTQFRVRRDAHDRSILDRLLTYDVGWQPISLVASYRLAGAAAAVTGAFILVITLVKVVY